jgi:hypothetical protein
VVAGEKGKKIVVTDEGKFDPSSIPRKKWEEYQAELWDTQTARDDTRSEISGYSYATKANPAVSEYGGYYSNSRPGSTAGGNVPMPPQLPYDARNASRMSFAASDMMGGNRQSHFGGSQFFSPEDMVGLPSDDALLAEIREILRTADLMTVTKKGVKQELERRFGVPLDAKKPYINSGMFITPFDFSSVAFVLTFFLSHGSPALRPTLRSENSFSKQSCHSGDIFIFNLYILAWVFTNLMHHHPELNWQIWSKINSGY